MVVQLVTIAGYTALLAGIVDVLSGGDAEADLSTLLEALILATAAALVVWFLFLAPLRLTQGIGVGDALGALAYPAIDLAMFAVAGRTLLRYRRISPALWLLLPALVATAATDGAGLLAFAGVTHPGLWFGLGGSLMGNAFVAAAALHPSVARPLLASPRPVGSFLRVRVVLVGAATCIAPLLMLFYEATDQLTSLPEVAIGALLIAGLVASDVFLLLTRLEASLRARVSLEGELKRQAQSDSLTELPNRAAFVVRLNDVLRGDHSRVALLLLRSRRLQDGQRHPGPWSRRPVAGRGGPAASRRDPPDRPRGAPRFLSCILEKLFLHVASPDPGGHKVMPFVAEDTDDFRGQCVIQ